MGACRSTYRRETDDLNASLCDLPVELRALVLSHVEHVGTRQILGLSSTFEEALSLRGALPRTFDFEGVAGDDIADHLVRVLHDDRVRRSLGKERALELIGDEKDRLCEYACGRNFEVLKWAHNELDLPWAPYPAGRVSDDVLVLRVLRGTLLWWPENEGPEQWARGVTMKNGRVVELDLANHDFSLRYVAVPAEIWQLTSLEKLYLEETTLTSVPAEIGQLTSLRELYLRDNHLESVPAEIGQLTSLEKLNLSYNHLTSLPAEIGQLTSLRELELGCNLLTSLPAEIRQLASLRELGLSDNELTSLPAEIGQLASLQVLELDVNQLTSVPAAIRELEWRGCSIRLGIGIVEPMP